MAGAQMTPRILWMAREREKQKRMVGMSARLNFSKWCKTYILMEEGAVPNHHTESFHLPFLLLLLSCSDEKDNKYDLE